MFYLILGPLSTTSELERQLFFQYKVRYAPKKEMSVDHVQSSITLQ